MKKIQEKTHSQREESYWRAKIFDNLKRKIGELKFQKWAD